MWQSFIWLLTAVILLGIFVSWVSYPAMGTWYQTLNKPRGCPSEFMWVLMWPIIYTLLLLSVYFAYESLFCCALQGYLILMFVVIAVLIALLPYVMFCRRNLTGAAVVALFLLITVLIQFWLIVCQVNNPIAGALFLPVVLWILFLVYVTFGLAAYNKTC